MRTIDDFTIPKEYETPFEKYLRRLVRDLIDKEVMPYRRTFDEEWGGSKRVKTIYQKLFVDLGLQRFLWPAEYGGWNFGKSSWTATAAYVVMEEIARADTGLAVAFACGMGWPNFMISFLPMRKNERLLEEISNLYTKSDKPIVSCLAMTEPQGGSDIENTEIEHGRTIQTTAELDGNEWVINGHKLWPTNSAEADLYAVICTTNRGSMDDSDLSVIMVPADKPGVKRGEPYQKAGMAADLNTDIWFDDVRVPDYYRACGPGEDMIFFKSTLDNIGVLGSVSFCVGAMKNVYEILKDYVSKKTYYGKAMKENDAIAGVLADIAAKIEASHLIARQFARMLDRPDQYGSFFSSEIHAKARTTKLFVCDKCNEVCSEAMDILGTHGYDRDHDIEKQWRDVKMIQLWMGSKQICEMETARWFYGCETI